MKPAGTSGFLAFVAFLISPLVMLSGFSPAAESTGREAEPWRMVFPVPEAVAGIFDAGGLAAFDPFHLWEPGSSRPLSPGEAADPGSDGARLPPGLVYDVLPVWTERGFKPHPGTRVLYHPNSHFLFVRADPGDEAGLRGLCSWPKEAWAGNSGEGVESEGEFFRRQAQLLVTAWTVPVEGAGGWRFQPLEEGDFLKLPESARRAAGRQSLVLRAGNAGRVNSSVVSLREPDGISAGFRTEAEVSLLDDMVTHRVSGTFELTLRLDSGELVSLEAACQHLAAPGQGWLVEAGVLPGHPVRRVFFTCSLRQAGLESWRLVRWSEVLPRWTGIPLKTLARSSRVIGYGWNLEDCLARLPEAGAKPAAAGSEKKEESSSDAEEKTVFKPGLSSWDDLPKSKVPELFGGLEVQDVSAILSRSFGLAPGTLRAWKAKSKFFLEGEAPVLADVMRRVRLSERSADPVNPVFEILLKVSSSPDTAGGGEVVSRLLLPMIRGQKSLVNLSGMEWGDPEKIPWGELTLEAPEPKQPEDGEKSPPPLPLPWTLSLGLSLSAPLTEAPVVFKQEFQIGSGGVVTPGDCRVALLPDGRELTLSLRRRMSVPAPPDAEVESPLGLWWSQTLEKAALPPVK